MGGFSIRGCQYIACRVIGVSVVVRYGWTVEASDSTALRKQLVLIIVGVGSDIVELIRAGQDISGVIIDIGISVRLVGRSIRCSVIVHGFDLGGSLAVGNIPVGIVPGKDTAAHGGQPTQAVIAHGERCQCCSVPGNGEGVQAAVRGIVGEVFRVGIAAHLPALFRQLIAGIIGLAGSQHGVFSV